ncbi:gamma-glutamyl-gamma-aminobutyrate hydrolase [Virgibacillus profundi]|uniref:Gamma-glutamyl-gamma-aminobutyrate hydrolase n=1 Tax=Virgibacillus profundi TaxID=2024555 RepID=A0A2A2IAF1_9BACI|nr:gamma-glutamyl-gamma-aminobutyrate hydrolase family protein [Virgibacillus profundi]PAV28023.1 gamma-glutamyl-gamma-aminobutyrate hydrolase [Virgibacillus profundi]PXY52201.1 gamma-glutamyl-gamma-aminobutyrate hydrolase [Virgibacillus profundi]
MKPLIGVTSSMEMDQSHYAVTNRNIKAISRVGGIPLMLPYLLEDIDQIANEIDGLYLTGGYDIDPILFGEEPHPKLGTIIPERDQFEFSLIKKLLEMGKPILGVCRGCQILNIVAGGDMYQDIYAQIDRELLQHTQKAPLKHGSHFVNVLKGSLLHQLTGLEKFRINSWHHQANRSVPDTFQISGEASDGVIEAIESKAHPFVLGLQWHPEGMDDEGSLKIYQGFMAACLEYKKKRA